MNKFMSLVFLYNRASHRKTILIGGLIPVGFLAVFLLKIGNPYDANSNMLMEQGFGGVLPVLVFVVANLLGLLAVTNSLNGRKDLKATHATTGYTMRRLRVSPTSAYLTIFCYYLAMVVIFWTVAIASLCIIGGVGLSMAGTTDISTKLALGMLRTEIGHALIPIAHPMILVFDIVVAFSLAAQCAKSCYLRWHNGTSAASALVIIIPMLLVWNNVIESSYILMVLIVMVIYAAFSFGDVLSREKHPKGDPFLVNKYEGIMDLDSVDFDDSVYIDEINSLVGDETGDVETSVLEMYGRDTEDGKAKGLRRFNPAWLRRRFMPLGINMNRVNGFFAACIALGVGEHLLFYAKYRMQLSVINDSIKGVTIDPDAMMPQFWDLQAQTYYGYLVAVLLVIFVQAFWNYSYYNKKTKSVYVMKRLPDRKEYARTIWISPIIQALFIVLIMILHTAIDFGLYALITPEIALYPDYLTHILPF